MLVVAKNSQYLFRANGESYLLKRGVLTSVPAWVAADPWFRDLCNAGKIAVSESTKDTAVEKAVEEAEVKVQKKTKKKTSK